MTQANSSYFRRCQQWLAQTQDISAQTLFETIAKFTQQLESLDETQQALAEDLMATLDVLNDALMNLEEQGLEGQYTAQVTTSPQTTPSQTTPLQAVENTVEATLEAKFETTFDSSSLQNYDDAQVQLLSEQERQDRLQTLLAQAGVSRGMPPTTDKN